MSHINYMFFVMLALAWVCAFALNSALRMFIKHAPANLLLESVSKPAGVMLWCLALLTNIIILRHYLLIDLDRRVVQTGLQIIFVVFTQWSAQRYIKKAEENTTYVDKTTALALSRLAKIATAIVGAIMLMYTINVDVRALLALGSAGTIVVGIAARDLLANFFGGFMLFIDRPFSVGDMIKADDKDIEGVVQHIGWRRTQLLTQNQCLSYIPNLLFLSMSIQNISRAQHQSIDVSIILKGVAANEIDKVLSSMEMILRCHNEVAKNMPISVNLKCFDSSGLHVRIYCFTNGYDLIKHAKVQQDIFIKIAKIVDSWSHEHNILERKVVELSRT